MNKIPAACLSASISLALLSSCLRVPVKVPEDITPKAAPSPERVAAPAPVAVLRTFDATGKATGEHQTLGAIVIKPPGFFAEFTEDDAPKRLYIRESKVTITAE